MKMLNCCRRIRRLNAASCIVRSCRASIEILVIVLMARSLATVESATIGRDMFPVALDDDGHQYVEQGLPYYIVPAAFGSVFPSSEYVNFMVPPTTDDVYLCKYPKVLDEVLPIDRTDPKYGVFSIPTTQGTQDIDDGMNVTSSNATLTPSSFATDINGSVTADDPVPVKIGLIVRRGNCTIEQKALVLLDVQRRLNLTGILQYLLIYEDEFRNRDSAVTFVTNNITVATDDGIGNIGIAYLPYNFLADLQLKIQAAYHGKSKYGEDGGDSATAGTTRPSVSPYFLSGPENYNWTLVFRIAGPTEPLLSYDSTYDGFSTLFLFRFVLFILLIVGPCGRGLYLWYAGGGRILLRRNDRGYVIGLQYIPPRPWWFAAGQVNFMSNNTAADPKRKVLTEEEFKMLPEVSYDGPPPESSEHDDDDDVSTDAAKETDAPKTNRKDDDVESQITAADTLSSGAEESKATTCTMCSICIDDFQPGEKIILLPKCKHAFHRSCIHPWLLERQGLCPLCKVPAIDGIVEDAEDGEDRNMPPSSSGEYAPGFAVATTTNGQNEGRAAPSEAPSSGELTMSVSPSTSSDVPTNSVDPVREASSNSFTVAQGSSAENTRTPSDHTRNSRITNMFGWGRTNQVPAR